MKLLTYTHGYETLYHNSFLVICPKLWYLQQWKKYVKTFLYLPIGDRGLCEERRQVGEVILMIVDQSLDHGALRTAERHPAREQNTKIS